MAPPSVWSKDGRREQLEFVKFGEPSHCDATYLKQRVTLAAIAMILAKHFGNYGFGHDVRLAWAGYLLRLGLSTDDLVLMGGQISHHCHNTEVHDVRAAVESQAKSLKAGDKHVAGGPVLATIIGAKGPDVILRINAWLGHEAGPQLVVRKASEVPDEHLELAFGGRLTRGAFPFVVGPAESGKGMFIVWLIACLTTGAAFPGDDITRPPMNVLICVTEDSEGRVKSRLRAAGADLDRVFFIGGPEVRRGGLVMPSPMRLDDDASSLVRHAQQLQAGALFLETVVEHFGDREGKVRRGTNNEAEVRSALAPFRAVCQTAGLFGLGAIHPRKSVEGGVEDSISGSAAFRNVPRGTLHIYRDPTDKTLSPVRLLFTSKASYLKAHPETLRFHIYSWDDYLAGPCQCPIRNCGHEGRLMWDTNLTDERSDEDIWKQIVQRNAPRRDVAVLEAEKFLRSLMTNGKIMMPPDEIFELAKDEGNSRESVQRAKRNLKLVSLREKAFPAPVVGWQEGEGE
jgi:hypothetical protein